MQSLVTRMYQDGQTTLQKEPAVAQKTDRHTATRLAYTIQSNVACMQLLLWAVQDESGLLHAVVAVCCPVQDESGLLHAVVAVGCPR